MAGVLLSLLEWTWSFSPIFVIMAGSTLISSKDNRRNFEMGKNKLNFFINPRELPKRKFRCCCYEILVLIWSHKNQIYLSKASSEWKTFVSTKERLSRRVEKTQLKSLNKVYENSLIKSSPHYFYGPARMPLMSSRSTEGYQIFINDINLFRNEIKNRRNGAANRADHLTSTSRLFEWRK